MYKNEVPGTVFVMLWFIRGKYVAITVLGHPVTL